MTLQLDQVSIFRAGAMLVSCVSATLCPGNALLVQGGNGSGKTSLLRTVCGWRPNFEGRIAWRGLAMPEGTEALRDSLAYLGHREGLHEDLTPMENLRWIMALGGEPCCDEQVGHALSMIGLPQARRRPVRVLSQGQRRRVALARLLLTRKPLWVLDEPLAFLDTAAQQIIRGCVSRHLQAGGMALLSCHTDTWPPESSFLRLSLTPSAVLPA